MTTVIAVGGFLGSSFDAASQWIDKTIGHAANVYTKNKAAAEFQGLLFFMFKRGGSKRSPRPNQGSGDEGK